MRDWETLYREHFPEVRGYFLSQGLNPMDADDLVQEVFEALAREDMPQDARPYIHAVARNILCRHRRSTITERAALDGYRRQLMTESIRTDSGSHDIGLSRRESDAEAERILKAVTASLPARYAQVVELCLVEGLSVRQVAERIGCSQDAVYKRIQRLRGFLRRFNWE